MGIGSGESFTIGGGGTTLEPARQIAVLAARYGTAVDHASALDMVRHRQRTTDALLNR